MENPTTKQDSTLNPVVKNLIDDVQYLVSNTIRGSLTTGVGIALSYYVSVKYPNLPDEAKAIPAIAGAISPKLKRETETQAQTKYIQPNKTDLPLPQNNDDIDDLRG